MKITIEIDEKSAEKVLEIASERPESLNAVIHAIFDAGITVCADRPAKKPRKPRAKRVKPENGTEATKSASQTAPGDVPIPPRATAPYDGTGRPSAHSTRP